MFSNKWFYTPWGEMDRLLREMNDVFSSLEHSKNRQIRKDFPLINMWGNENEVILEAELPGIDPEKLNIHALEDMISIEGKRDEDIEKEMNFHRQERRMGSFKRVFQLPYQVEPEKVEAKYEKGILRITLPRSEENKPKKISVSK